MCVSFGLSALRHPSIPGDNRVGAHNVPDGDEHPRDDETTENGCASGRV
jgi:hypothetical protein